MLPEASPAEHTYGYRITPLRWLEGECASRGLIALLVPDMIRAYLRVISRRGAEVTVWLDAADGGERCFRWGEPPTTHPLVDPAGCARRLAAVLYEADDA